MDQLITSDIVFQHLKSVIDPELNINIVDLGLVYGVDVDATKKETPPFITITITLTTPGCPLAGMFDRMVKDALFPILPNPERDVKIILTFDPPWVSDMMSEEARAELGF